MIYDIATNAANTANTLAEAMKANQDTEYQCTNTTESNYVRDTAATYDLLDSCLKNGVPTTSSAAPSTTVAPLSTQGVQSTTQSPATTVANVVASSPAASSAAPVVIASTAATV